MPARLFFARIRACALALLACALASGATPARAQTAPAPGLNWLRLEGAESCLSAAELAQSVEARVGRVLFVAPSAAALFVDGSVRRVAPGRWQVELGISTARGQQLGQRTLEIDGADCRVIDDAVALVIAVTLNPRSGLPELGIPLDPGTADRLDALFGGEPSELDPATLPAAVPAEAERQTRRAPPEPRARRAPARAAPAEERAEPPARWRSELEALAATGVGQLPGATLGFGVHARVTPPDGWPLELGLVGFLPATREVGELGRGRFQLLLGSLATCPLHAGRRLVLRLCAGAELGRLRVEPEGFAQRDAPVNDLIFNALGTLALQLPIARSPYLQLALIALVPITQRAYLYEGPDGSPQRLFRMPQAALRLELGMGAAF